MAKSTGDLTSQILTKLGTSSLTDLAEWSPSALTTDAYVCKAEDDLRENRIEEAFSKLSLTHSTLLHQRMSQQLHKPSQKNNEKISAGIDVEVSKSILATADKEETLKLLQMLPSDWTVVQITSSSVGEANLHQIVDSHPTTPGLYISRCSCGPAASVTVQMIPPPEKEGVRGIIQELEIIKEQNKLLSKDYRDQYEKYWQKRQELDCRLKSVVHSMDAAWLRYWACLMAGGLAPQEQKNLEEVTSRILSSNKITFSQNQIRLFQCLISCPQIDKNVGLEGITFSIPAGIAAILGESVRSQSVKNLYKAVQKESSTLDKLRQAERNPVILILDKAIVTLPWEMIWVLRDQTVTRMPSLRMLSVLYQHHASQTTSVLVQGVDPTKGYYVLDPENNLPKTQGRLNKVLVETGWEGTNAQKPTHEQFKDALMSKDIFVYVGHGSGSQYMPGEVVEGVHCRAVVLLYGCSSVKLAPRGRVPDPWGVVLNYLIAFCPCIVGMLWEVTDRDTDRLTQEMLNAIVGREAMEGSPLVNPPTDIALLVARARSLCKWHLTKAALSVYGLPLHLISNSN